MSQVRVVQGAVEIRRRLLARTHELASISDAASQRAAQVFGEDLSARAFVARLVREVRDDGDVALRRIATALGDPVPLSFEISTAELAAARGQAPPGLAADLSAAAERVEGFHRGQMPADFMDDAGAIGQRWLPVDRAGIYVPGGAAPLASSLLMAVIPARVAGVSQIVVCTPLGNAGIPPAIAVAAEVSGVERVFGIGGAQAIAALAFGTGTVPRCDVVAGPGNAWVVLAKREIFGNAGIDLLPGPTETLIVFDASADPADVAADLLAQAEHGGPAAPIGLTPDPSLAADVARAVARQIASLPLRETAWDSFMQRGGIGVVSDLAEAVELANEFAPEHLCLLVADPDALLPRIRHAGGVFVGAGSPEVLGDYVAGPSHIMPTGGTARFASPGGVYAYLKATSIVRLGPDDSAELAPLAARLARAEGLEGHARAAERRLPRHPA